MHVTSPRFRWWLSGLPAAVLCLGLSACVMPAGSAGAAPHGVSEVTMERDCFGCAAGTRVVLRSDGTASVTQVGKARRGTQDVVRQGRIGTQEFDALVALMLQRGFFRLADRYEPADIQDGAWLLTRATRAGQEKEVFAREDAAPPELRAVETAIDALQKKLFPGP